MCTGSLIENADGTCRSTGGFTTGIEGLAQGMAKEGAKAEETKFQAAYASVEAQGGNSAPESSTDPLEFSALTPSEFKIMSAIMLSKAYLARSNYSWSQTMKTGKEHGFLIWYNGRNSFTLGKVVTGNTQNMGQQWSKLLSYYATSYYAGFHTHPGTWNSSRGPSEEDLNVNARFSAIGVIRSRWGTVAGH